MVASTDIKFYVHTNNNAPQLQNAFGSMINVLDACLVNGINIGTVSSLTASGTTVTALFSSSHNLMQYQVIKITGAAQSEFNGEHRVLTVPNAQSITFELATAPSVTTATGAIEASLPPLGWEKPFSSTHANGGGKAAYRSKNLLLPSRPFLRVVDELDSAYTATYAKYAKVGIVEDMTDIDTMLGVQAPFDAALPDKNWVGTGSGANAINGWSKWYYATASSPLSSLNDTYAVQEGNRSYVVIGTKDHFFLYVCPKEGLTNHFNYGFGAFERFLSNDTSNWFLFSTTNAVSANYGYEKSRFTGGMSSTNNGIVHIFRVYTQDPLNTVATCSGLQAGSKTNDFSGWSNIINANKVVAIVMSPLFLWELNNATVNAGDNPILLRGKIPLVHWLYQANPFFNFQIIENNGEYYLAIGTFTGSFTGQTLCKIA